MPTSIVTRSEEAYRRLREAIVRQELPQGAWLRQRTLAAELGMSPTPLVQAFQRLEHEGLVESVPQWGVRVRALTVRELKQIYGMRAALESLVFRELASNLDLFRRGVQDLRPLARDVDLADEELRVDVLEGRRDVGESLLIDLKFHLALAELSKLEMVTKEIDRLCLLPSTVHAWVAKKTPTAIKHVKLLDAILTGEPETAESAIRKAINFVADTDLPVLEKRFGNQPILFDGASQE
jgi:DNA-binding GntR family transcriptional regulator